MKKRKVQVVIYYKALKKTYFLLLKTNKRRGEFWQNITGGVDQGENDKDAALREAIEETALCPTNLISLTNLNTEFSFHDQWGNDVSEQSFSIHCHGPWNIVLDPSEHSSYQWVESHQLGPNSVKYESNLKVLLKVKALQC